MEPYDKALYELVWRMMDASNLSGVIHDLPRVADMVRAELQEQGNDDTSKFNQHVVWRVIADKINQLSNAGDGATLGEDYHLVNLRRL